MPILQNGISSRGGLPRRVQQAAQSANTFLRAGAPIPAPCSVLLRCFFGMLAALFFALIAPMTASALPGEFTLNQPATSCKDGNPVINLSWGASPNATQYGVYRNGWVYDPNAHSLKFDNTDHVSSGKTYTYFVRASDATGATDSNSVTVTAPDCTATEADIKLYERICDEYGYIRRSDDFAKCMKDPLAIGPRTKGGRNPAEVGLVHDTDGEVRVASNCLMEQPIDKGAALEKSMVISTGEKSHAVLKFEDGHVITLRANTTFTIQSYLFSYEGDVENNNMLVSILKGGLRSITGLLGKIRPAAIKVHTPSATIGIRGTDFMVATDGKEYHQVISGSIELGTVAGKEKLDAGEVAVVSSIDTYTKLSAQDIPAEILAQFTQLKAIPVPPPTPIHPPAHMPVSGNASLAPLLAPGNSTTDAKTDTPDKKRSPEAVCQDIGYGKNTVEFKTCLEYIEESESANGGKKKKKR